MATEYAVIEVDSGAMFARLLVERHIVERLVADMAARGIPAQWHTAKPEEAASILLAQATRKIAMGVFA